jgi:AcrR family transcriptional regulator
MKKSKIGRPRAFDPDEALDRALEVFWRSGYEGASLSDLTEAMGITRPSLYAAFGNKEELFRKALDRYAERSAGLLLALEDGSARAGIQRFLMQAIGGQCASSQSGRAQSRGCLLVQGALACSEEGENVRKELAARRGRMQDVLRDRLIRAKQEGELPEACEPTDLARYFATVSNGLSVQASGGASREDLVKVVEAAMRAWPVEAGREPPSRVLND